MGGVDWGGVRAVRVFSEAGQSRSCWLRVEVQPHTRFWTRERRVPLHCSRHARVGHAAAPQHVRQQRGARQMDAGGATHASSPSSGAHRRLSRARMRRGRTPHSTRCCMRPIVSDSVREMHCAPCGHALPQPGHGHGARWMRRSRRKRGCTETEACCLSVVFWQARAARGTLVVPGTLCCAKWNSQTAAQGAR
mgnify:CR=1 FL=1